MKLPGENTLTNPDQAYYLELEDKIYYLRLHYSMCQGIKKEEMLEWARFFLAWSREASQRCDIWSQENLRDMERFVKSLEKAKADTASYAVLEKAMAEAALRLDHEILKVFQSTGLGLETKEKRLFL